MLVITPFKKVGNYRKISWCCEKILEKFLGHGIGTPLIMKALCTAVILSPGTFNPLPSLVAHSARSEIIFF